MAKSLNGPTISRILHPLHDLRQGRPLAIHENADAIDTRADPEQSINSSQQNADAQRNLPPRGLLHHDAHEHEKRRAKRDHRERN